MARSTKRLRHIYHLKKLYVSWRLRVLTHAHTGKRVHRQHTSFALLALLLVATAAVLTRSTISTYALQDSGGKTISAVVSSPPPTQKATISSPADGATFTEGPITVTGSCQLGSYQQLFRNQYPSGTAQCAPDGTYSILTDLFTGANDLVVRSYNLAGTAGPDSAVTRVTYTPPAQPETPAVQGSTSSGPSSGNGSTSDIDTPPPLTLRNDYVIRGYAIGQAAQWKVAVGGGTAPYSVSVNWGDGTTALYASKTADTLTLNHVYQKPAPNSNYLIIVRIVDAAGMKATLQILALITDTANAASSSTGAVAQGPFSGLFGGGSSTGNGAATSLWRVIGSLWTAVVTAALILLAFWLGEVRELRLIKRRFKITKLT